MFCNLKNIRNIHNEKLVEEYFHLLDEMEKDNVQSPTQSKLGCNNTNINLLDVICDVPKLVCESPIFAIN